MTTKRYWIHPNNCHEMIATTVRPTGCVEVVDAVDYNKLREAARSLVSTLPSWPITEQLAAILPLLRDR